MSRQDNPPPPPINKILDTLDSTGARNDESNGESASTSDRNLTRLRNDGTLEGPSTTSSAVWQRSIRFHDGNDPLAVGSA